jgi:hypothetical protein
MATTTMTRSWNDDDEEPERGGGGGGTRTTRTAPAANAASQTNTGASPTSVGDAQKVNSSIKKYFILLLNPPQPIKHTTTRPARVGPAHTHPPPSRIKRERAACHTTLSRHLPPLMSGASVGGVQKVSLSFYCHCILLTTTIQTKKPDSPPPPLSQQRMMKSLGRGREPRASTSTSPKCGWSRTAGRPRCKWRGGVRQRSPTAEQQRRREEEEELVLAANAAS